MPVNVPTYDTAQFSFGPGVIFLGPTGATPTADVGAITEEGVQIEVQAEKKVISQGNPRTPIYTFAQAHGFMFRMTGIEWDFDDLSKILGAGTTTSAGGQDTFAFGGEPIVSEVAIRMRHYMASPGHTLYVNVWKAASEGGLGVQFGQDEHQFAHSYMALRATTDWASAALAYGQQLVQLVRVTA